MDQDRREPQVSGDFDKGKGKVSWQNLLDTNPDRYDYVMIDGIYG